ncbi:helix-turn-helix transcriptional regulator [Mycolicibacterium fortuitum]|uniref:helix-turn-helix transcriptional regulator n=1 Tax=Mycolicibacterium fortuitum TaxID=1766 RepID=UPI00148F5C0A|nr:XRE family transcriptional regulator [Mycolicibacterium fortuitum]
MEDINNRHDSVAESGPARLDHFIRRRTAQLRISSSELASRGGPDRSTLHKAVNGTGRRLRESTLTRIDTALGWAPGSAAQVLDGGLPETRMALTGADEHAVTVIGASLDILREARELIRESEALLQGLLGDRNDQPQVS